MVKLETVHMPKSAPLFQDLEITMLWSCLEGFMGNAWADNIENPRCARIITADFCCFAGDSSSSEAVLFVKDIPSIFPKNSILMVPENDAWGTLIEQVWEGRYEKFSRYELKKEKGIFDLIQLKSFVEKLKAGYTLAAVDERLFYLTRQEDWSSDLCSQFPTYEDFHKRGLGFVVLHEERPISGASSYTIYSEGIEIEIDTKPEYRRQGFATVCAAALILECISRGLYPSWDAANRESLALAEKLGYHFDREYTAYQVEIRDSSVTK
ncbi:MAG: GNAT family N-acetyltransferase [Ruminiclostridium sp.]|nr:GNAT family N-acetyltransferase [Ruminiclostridium sp.]